MIPCFHANVIGYVRTRWKRNGGTDSVPFLPLPMPIMSLYPVSTFFMMHRIESIAIHSMHIFCTSTKKYKRTHVKLSLKRPVGVSTLKKIDHYLLYSWPDSSLCRLLLRYFPCIAKRTKSCARCYYK